MFAGLPRDAPGDQLALSKADLNYRQLSEGPGLLRSHLEASPSLTSPLTRPPVTSAYLMAACAELCIPTCALPMIASRQDKRIMRDSVPGMAGSNLPLLREKPSQSSSGCLRFIDKGQMMTPFQEDK